MAGVLCRSRQRWRRLQQRWSRWQRRWRHPDRRLIFCFVAHRAPHRPTTTASAVMRTRSPGSSVTSAALTSMLAVALSNLLHDVHTCIAAGRCYAFRCRPDKAIQSGVPGVDCLIDALSRLTPTRYYLRPRAVPCSWCTQMAHSSVTGKRHDHASDPGWLAFYSDSHDVPNQMHNTIRKPIDDAPRLL